MPARTVQAVTAAQGPAQLGQHLVSMAGMFDDPIAAVRVSVGPILTGPPQAERDITLQVVDRLGKPYAGRSFTDKRGRRSGRWLVWMYLAETEFGAPVGAFSGPTVTGGVGRIIDQGGSGLLHLVCTDPTGKAVLRVAWTPADLWVHVGVPVLLRAHKLAAWQSSPEGSSDGDVTPGDDGSTAGGGSGGSSGGIVSS